MRFTYRRQISAIFEQYPAPWDWTMGTVRAVNGKVICYAMMDGGAYITAVWGLYSYAPPHGCRVPGGLPPLLGVHPLPWRLDVTGLYTVHGEEIVLRDRYEQAVMDEGCRPELSRIMYGLAMLHADRAYVRYAAWVHSRSISRWTPQ